MFKMETSRSSLADDYIHNLPDSVQSKVGLFAECLLYPVESSQQHQLILQRDPEEPEE